MDLKELPRYRCHKEVWALKIVAVNHRDQLLVFEEPWLTITVSNTYLTKHDPQPGGYYVRYEDGYESFSPADAFESGYTLIAEE